ncbi:MAG: BON domain-containing protein [Dehalococcoidia bacterium]
MNRSNSRRVQAVYDALNETEPLESVGFRINVEERDGGVRLSGIVRTEVHRYLAAKTAGGVHDVKAVQNDLVSDLTLASEVSRALAADPELARVPFLVQSTLGEVTLTGAAEDPAMADRAVDIARRQPGVVDARLQEQP